MLRITVFGATGATGSRVVAEALSRGHQVTAVSRRAVPASRSASPTAAPAAATPRPTPGPHHEPGVPAVLSASPTAAPVAATPHSTPGPHHEPGVPAVLSASPTAALAAAPHPAPAPQRAIVVRGDASDPGDVARLAVGQDVVISATRPVPGQEHELAIAAKGLVSGLAGSGVRLLVVGGAASLTLPGSPGTTVVDGPDFPAEVRPIALACNEQLEVIRAATDLDWVYLSPAAVLEPGSRTGNYRLGKDELLVDAAGNSFISMEDLAVALLDEAERPRHHRTRFTVGY